MRYIPRRDSTRVANRQWVIVDLDTPTDPRDPYGAGGNMSIEIPVESEFGIIFQRFFQTKKKAQAALDAAIQRKEAACSNS